MKAGDVITQQTPVPRGHCGRCATCGSRFYAPNACIPAECAREYLPDGTQRPALTHCPGCGAPYTDTVIMSELSRMARTLTAADDLPDIGRAKPGGITPEAAASVLGYERARAMGATTNVRIDPVDFQADPTGAIRAARERGSVVLTDDDGKPRMRIGAPLRSDTVPDDVRALLTEAKAALEWAIHWSSEESVRINARAAAKAIGEALATAPHDPADRGRHASPSHVELWNAIDEYVSSCGVVDLSRTSDRRMTAVARVERAVDAIARKRMTEDAALRAALDARAPRDYSALDSTEDADSAALFGTNEAVHAANRAIAEPVQSEPANDDAIQTTHVPSFQAGWASGIVLAHSIVQSGDGAEEAIRELMNADAPTPVTIDQVVRWANEWTVEHGRKDPLDMDGPAALGAFVGWLRERVRPKQ